MGMPGSPGDPAQGWVNGTAVGGGRSRGSRWLSREQSVSPPQEPSDCSDETGMLNLSGTSLESEGGLEMRGFVAQCPHCLSVGVHSSTDPCDVDATTVKCYRCPTCKYPTTLCSKGKGSCQWAAVPSDDAGTRAVCVVCSNGVTITEEQYDATAFIADHLEEVSHASRCTLCSASPCGLPSPCVRPATIITGAAAVCRPVSAYRTLQSPGERRPMSLRRGA